MNTTFQPALDAGVVVDPLRQLVDGVDDILGQLVTRRRLGAEDEHARCMSLVGVRQQTTVERHDVDEVQLLALVLSMQTLDLDVEDRLRAHLDAGFGLDDLDQLLLVVTLDGRELLLEGLVVGKLHHAAQLVELQRPFARPPPRCRAPASSGLQASSQRRGVTPLVTLHIFSGHSSAYSEEDHPSPALRWISGHAVHLGGADDA